MKSIGKDKNTTKEKLIENGREEFLRHGYLRASLRNICKASGVTTGAFYFAFPSKEALFLAILSPVVREWEELVKEIAKRELESPETGIDNDQEIMEFEYRHKKEIQILLEGAKGSCYEEFKVQLVHTMEEAFTIFFEKTLGHQPKKEIITILVKFRIQSNLDIIKEDYDMEKTLEMAKIIGCYAEGGFQKLIEDMKEML